MNRVMMLFLFLALNVGPMAGVCQSFHLNRDTICFNYSRVENLRNNQQIVLSGKMISYRGKTLHWYQENVERPYIIELFDNLTGEIAAKRFYGNITSDVECESISGMLSIFRDEENLVLVLDFSTAGELTPKIKFYIDSITTP
jgi:hypothetical protein